MGGAEPPAQHIIEAFPPQCPSARLTLALGNAASTEHSQNGANHGEGWTSATKNRQMRRTAASVDAPNIGFAVAMLTPRTRRPAQAVEGPLTRRHAPKLVVPTNGLLGRELLYGCPGGLHTSRHGRSLPPSGSPCCSGRSIGRAVACRAPDGAIPEAARPTSLSAGFRPQSPPSADRRSAFASALEMRPSGLFGAAQKPGRRCPRRCAIRSSALFFDVLVLGHPRGRAGRRPRLHCSLDRRRGVAALIPSPFIIAVATDSKPSCP